MKTEEIVVSLRKKAMDCSLLFAACCLLLSSFLSGCARMGAPDGGWYDDTPPRVISSSPGDRATAVKSRRVTINFNEFIKLEDAQSKVIVSPPQLEQPDIKAAGKRIVIDLKDSLKQNTTYTIDFSDAITDNNEGNPMGNYTFSFSTGNRIDTFEVSGYALDASNLEPIKGILVGLYSLSTDSALAEKDSTAHAKADSTGGQGHGFRTSPMVRVSRTNGSGRFTIKGVAPGSYNVYALQDNDGDYVYTQKSEMIGFSHEVVVPSAKPDVRQDTIWRDSLRIDNILQTGYTHFLPDDVTLLCFQAPQTDRYLVKTERKEPEKIGLFFSYGCDSLPKLRGLNFEADSAFIVEASEKRDTVYYWLRDTALVNQDTLLIERTYMMTDSTGVLVEKTDTMEALPKTPYEKRMKELEKELEKWQKAQEKKKKRDEPYDTVMRPKPLQVQLSARSQLDPDTKLWFDMPVPLAYCDSTAVHLYMMVDSVWYDVPHRFSQCSTRRFLLQADWQMGAEYSLEVDSAAFRSIYGLVSDPIKQGMKVRTEDSYSSLALHLQDLPDSLEAVVQLLDGQDKVVREVITKKGEADFFYLKPGEYYVRAFVDMNGNGIWDTGDYDQDLQAEPMYYYHEKLDCKEKWDVSRDWMLNGLQRFKQKPTAITKQKPDKEKQLRNRNAQRAAEKGIKYIEKETGIRLK